MKLPVLTAEQIRQAESNGHSIFGASGLHRKISCAGSLLAEFGLPDDAGVEAAEGTVAHGIAEEFLRAGIAEIPEIVRQEMNGLIIDERGFKITVDLSMLEYVEQYLQWCLECPGKHYVETRVDYSQLTPIPNQGGTADFAACEFRLLNITDLKYGTGLKVFAERNPQAMAYALGFIFEWDWLYDFDRVIIRICQPRLGHFDVWETTKADLLAWGQWLKGRLALTWQHGAPRTPSEYACQYCKARLTCTARLTIAQRLADDTFDDETVTITDMSASQVALRSSRPMELARPADLDTTDLALVMDYRKMFEDWFAQVAAELQRRVAAGDPIPVNYMMAAGKTQRSVISQAKVVAMAEMNGISAKLLYETVFLSPAKIEELFVRELRVRKNRVVAMLDHCFNSVEGKPVLKRKGPDTKAPTDLASLSFDDESQDIL